MNAPPPLWKLPICLYASCRSDPSGSRCAASHKLTNNLVRSFNSSASGIPTVRRLNVESSMYERINVGVGGRDGIARRVREESKCKWQYRCSCHAQALAQQKVLF